MAQSTGRVGKTLELVEFAGELLGAVRIVLAHRPVQLQPQDGSLFANVLWPEARLMGLRGFARSRSAVARRFRLEQARKSLLLHGMAHAVHCSASL